MYRYALRQSASVPRFLYPAKGYGIISLTLKLVWCKNSKNNEFRTKKFPNPEFLYGISSFCTLSENNSFLHGNISYFCIFLVKIRILNTEFSAMSHAIHKIVSKRRCQSYFISRRSPHHGISKDSDLCASAHRCPHYAYARLIARVNSPVTILNPLLYFSPESV